MKATLLALLKLKDTPRRTALAFGLGVFIAFSPFLGLHTVLAVVTAFLLRLSRVAVLAGAWINFWALGPSYVFGTFIGALLLGVDAGDLKAIDWDQGMSALGTSLRPLLGPILLGNTVLATFCGAGAYILARAYLERRARESNVKSEAAALETDR